jgi:uncharacterized protein (DUF58 family)
MRSPAHEPSEAPTTSILPAVGIAAAGLALTLAGLTFAAAPLLVAGPGFMLLGVLAPAWVTVAAQRATVRRHLSTLRIEEDEPLEAMVEVVRGPLGLPGAEVRDPIAGGAVVVSQPLSVISGSSRVELRVVARVHRRGRHTFAPPSLIVTDTLGLARVVKPGDGHTDELLVLPRTERVRWLQPEHRRPAKGQAVQNLQEPLGAGEVDGLRPYVPGSPASRIHWPALARGAGLLERRLVTEPHAQPLIVLDAREDGPPELLDAAVRAAASITLELARTGGCGVLLPGSRQPLQVAPDLAAWPGVHTRLALVEGSRDQAPALREGMVSGPTVYIAARLDHQSALPRVGQHATQLLLVVPAELGERLGLHASLAVSGCAGYVLRTRASRRAPRAAA